MQITTTNGGSLAEISDQDLMKVLQSSLYPGAAQESIKMVLGYCKASGLDPMQKPVHIVPMRDSKSERMRDVVMPGVGLYRTLAARSGCMGISEPEFGPDVTKKIGGYEITFPQWCRVTVKRKLSSGDVAEFTAKEFWLENYATKGGKEKSIAPNAMWSKRPFGQIAKCAEAQALRKAFPEVGAQPTADEMEGQIIERDEIDITPTTSKADVKMPKQKNETISLANSKNLSATLYDDNSEKFMTVNEKPKPNDKMDESIQEVATIDNADDSPPAGKNKEAYLLKQLTDKGVTLKDLCDIAELDIKTVEGITTQQFIILNRALAQS